METAVLGLKVPAKVCSDDCAKYAEFDASEWFATAPAERIINLARNGWRCERIAGELARRAAVSNARVADVLAYVMYLRHGGMQSGYTCSVDAVAALEWLAYRRPDLLAELRKAA